MHKVQSQFTFSMIVVCLQSMFNSRRQKCTPY